MRSGAEAELGVDRCLPEQFLLEVRILIWRFFDKCLEIEHINCQDEVLLEVKFILQLLDDSRYVNYNSECAQLKTESFTVMQLLHVRVEAESRRDAQALF